MANNNRNSNSNRDSNSNSDSNTSCSNSKSNNIKNGLLYYRMQSHCIFFSNLIFYENKVAGNLLMM